MVSDNAKAALVVISALAFLLAVLSLGDDGPSVLSDRRGATKNGGGSTDDSPGTALAEDFPPPPIGGQRGQPTAVRPIRAAAQKPLRRNESPGATPSPMYEGADPRCDRNGVFQTYAPIERGVDGRGKPKGISSVASDFPPNFAKAKSSAHDNLLELEPATRRDEPPSGEYKTVVMPLPHPCTPKLHVGGPPTTVHLSKRPLDHLEYRTDIPPVAYWRRKFDRLPKTNPKSVRVACMYSGFMRDFGLMLGTCTDILKSNKRHLCKKKRRRKMYGRQRRNVLEGTNCDVFISTWDLKGVGRYDRWTYNDKRVYPQQILSEYREQLAAFHMQNYSAYDTVWRYEHRFQRDFPQTHPTKQLFGPDGKAKFSTGWEGFPETRHYLRLNDYSQSYKQFAVLKLVEDYERTVAKGMPYDVYFRLRTDLRALKGFRNFHWINFEKREVGFDLHPEGNLGKEYGHNKVLIDDIMTHQEKVANGSHAGNSAAEGDESDDATSSAQKTAIKPLHVAAESSDDGDDDHKGPGGKNVTHHRVSANRIFANNFEISDFAFICSREQMLKLGTVWNHCAKAPRFNPSTPHVEAIDLDTIGEYNLMVWRIVFDNKWEIDAGGRALTPSRAATRKRPKKKGVKDTDNFDT